MSLSQSIQTQARPKAWEWLPWLKVLSERAALDARGRKLRASREETLDKLLGGSMEEELSRSPYKLQALLTVHGHAYAMCGAGHLGSWSLCVSISFHGVLRGDLARALPPSQLLPAWRRQRRRTASGNFSLCFSGATTDDAISSVVVDRDTLRHLLAPRPKVPKLPKTLLPRKEDCKDPSSARSIAV